MHTLAVFASGAGSNTQKIIDYFRNHPAIQVGLVVCNKPEAGVLRIAEKEAIPFIVIERARFFSADSYVNELKEKNVEFIVLAGFLWMVPAAVINAYPHKIVNIHPALLPKYGGKGMYGSAVHEAVIKAKEQESGITIHYVDDQYDHGQPILQVTCRVEEHDTPESLAHKIHALEHDYYPRVIEEIVEREGQANS